MSKPACVTLAVVLLCIAPGCDAASSPDAPSGGDAATDAPPDTASEARDGGRLDAALDTPGDDAPGLDDAGPDDTGPDDAGTPDAGIDAGTPDAGIDAGTPDAGIDAGTPDAGMPDAPDAGAPDAGAPDAGPPDAGMPDAGGPDAPPSEIVLANGNDLPACGAYAGSIWPVIPSELGHYAATRLTPPAYPFVVERVAYDLYVGLGRDCDQRFAHEVQVFVSSATRPPASPGAGGSVVTISVPAAADPGDRTVVLDLPSPAVLAAGEQLYVAVQLTGDATGSLCLGVCQVFAPVAGVDFWSNATAEPYPWSDMVVDYGFLSNFTIRAYGHAP